VLRYRNFPRREHRLFAGRGDARVEKLMRRCGRRKGGVKKRAMNEKLEKVIADLRAAFKKSDLESLWVTISAQGTIVGKVDAHGKAQSTASLATNGESNNAGAKSEL
jgi:hypothetical protein